MWAFTYEAGWLGRRATLHDVVSFVQCLDVVRATLSPMTSSVSPPMTGSVSPHMGVARACLGIVPPSPASVAVTHGA